MRWSQTFIHTQRQDPAEAEVVSHRLMIRAGMISKVAAGVYSYLPLGWRSLCKLQDIIREEMGRAGSSELVMPAVQPAELWQESRRWFEYGPELLRIEDRHQREFCFGPTHEEVITDIVRRSVTSYRQLPVSLFQIQVKFRDEIRPRFGLMRAREFLMKDAYSFHADGDDLDAAYRAMETAYRRVFSRCGLDFVQVEADTGNIGGSESHEFMVLASTGEDAVLSCPACDYGANAEKAESGELPDPPHWPVDTPDEPEIAATPGLSREAIAFSVKRREGSPAVRKGIRPVLPSRPRLSNDAAIRADFCLLNAAPAGGGPPSGTPRGLFRRRPSCRRRCRGSSTAWRPPG